MKSNYYRKYLLNPNIIHIVNMSYILLEICPEGKYLTTYKHPKNLAPPSITDFNILPTMKRCLLCIV